ncbi:MAG: hypothetical protein V1656_01785 [Candidatus Jorgensenbacteria bacterium]
MNRFLLILVCWLEVSRVREHASFYYRAVPASLYTAKIGDIVNYKGVFYYVCENRLDSTGPLGFVRIVPVVDHPKYPTSLSLHPSDLSEVREVVNFEKNQERWTEIVRQHISPEE